MWEKIAHTAIVRAKVQKVFIHTAIKQYPEPPEDPPQRAEVYYR